MVCLEVPAAGVANSDDIDLVALTEKTATQRQGRLSTTDTETVIVEVGSGWTVGEWDGSGVKDAAAHTPTLVNGHSLYLVHGGAIAGGGGDTYTAGKFCITLEGWLVPDDI